MQKHFALLFLAALATTAHASGNLNFGDSTKPLSGNLKTAPLVKELPAALKKKTKGARVYTIDLDGDGKPDFIAVSGKQTCYFDSSFKQRHCQTTGPQDGFVYYFFAQLDRDPMLELFEFAGDDDTSDYKVIKFDPKTWKPRVLFKFHPFLHPVDTVHKGLYWGYPWDITDLPLKHENGEIRFGAMKRLLDAAFAEEPAPAIFFEGVPSQGDATGAATPHLKDEEWLTLDEIVSALRKPSK